jgi:hypothetical protein
MLHKIAMAEEDESDTSSNISAPGSDRIEKPSSVSSGSAMSSVFGSSKRSSSSSRASSRTPSPSGRKKLPLPSFHRRTSSRGDVGKREKEDHLARWLQGGNVIYKSVGLGLMDLAVGIKLIHYAKDKGVGTHVDGF